MKIKSAFHLEYFILFSLFQLDLSLRASYPDKQWLKDSYMIRVKNVYILLQIERRVKVSIFQREFYSANTLKNLQHLVPDGVKFHQHTLFCIYNWQILILAEKNCIQSILQKVKQKTYHMKSSLIELLNIAGTPTACIELQLTENIDKLYDGQLLRIGQRQLYDYDGNLSGGQDGQEKYRFVVAKNPGEHDILLRVEPFRVYLRDHEMNSKVIEINPYQSVRWLRSKIQEERKTRVKLVVNEQQLTEDNESLLKFISQDAIIHILQLKPGQRNISTLYTKEPGSESKIYKLENVSTDQKIDWLVNQISRLTSIPYEYLHLVYGGKILPKDRQIFEYYLQNNGCVYAVDARKYMRKVSQSQYQSRLNEVRKYKQNNKPIIQRVRQEKEKQKFVYKSAQKSHKLRYIQEKSGSVMQDFGEDHQYFKNPQIQMQFESEEIKQFQRRGQQLQENIQNQEEKIKVNISMPKVDEQNQDGLATPPNTPVEQFSTLHKQQQQNSVGELREGRILTKQTKVYADVQGLIHEHHEQKIVYESGQQQIVDTDIAKDSKGHIVKVQHDEVNIKKDQETGNTIKIQTDVIENGQHVKTTIKTSQIRDSEGNLLKIQANVYKQESGEDGLKKQQVELVEDTQKVTQVNNQVIEDQSGEPVKIQTDISQKKQDQQGNIHEHSKDIKQQNGVTTVIEHDIVHDKEGNLIEQKKDTIQIRQDEQGNIYKHEVNEIEQEHKRTITERDIVISQTGELIINETKKKIIEQDENNNIHTHQTEVIQGVNGQAVTIQKDIFIDAEGNLIKSHTDIVEVNRSEQNPVQKVERALPQQQPIKSGQVQVSTDQQGNIHIVETQTVQNQGKTTWVDRDIVQDKQGNIIRVETDILTVGADTEGNTHKLKSQMIEFEDQVVMVQTAIVTNSNGIILREEKDTIQIDRGEDGCLIRNETDIIEEEGKTKIIEKHTVKDVEGNVISQQTKVTEVGDMPSVVNAYKQQEIALAGEDDQLLQDNVQQVSKTVEVTEDQEGYKLTQTKQVISDTEGKQTIVYTNTLQDKQGQIIEEKTQTVHISDEGEKPEIHKHIIEFQDQQNKVVIEQTTSREGFDGSVIRCETETIEIIQQEDGTIHTKEIDVIEQGGKKTVHVTDTIQDQSGKVLSKNQDGVEWQALQSEKANQIESQVQPETFTQAANAEQVTVTSATDEQGNLHILEKQVQNQQGKQKLIERQFVSNPQGELIKTETGILQVESNKDGFIHITATDIIQEGTTVTITQNESLQDSEGHQIRNQSGMLKIEDIGSGVRRKQKQNIIEEDGIKVRVQKQTFEDEEGNIISESVKTTELTEKIDESNKQVACESVMRKETEVVTDEQGNHYYKEKEIIDQQQGKTTIVQTELVRNEQGQIVKATTDVIQVTQQQDGTIRRHETNIVEKPDKVTMAESDSIENAEGQKIKGEVETIIVTKSQNGETIRKEVGITMQNMQRTIVEKTIIEDSQGNIIKVKAHNKRIYIDQNGVQQARDIEDYEANEDKVEGKPATFEKEVTVEKQGSVKIIERQTTQEGENQTKIVEITTIQNKEGDVVTLENNEIEIEKVEDGTQIVHETNIIEDNQKLTVVQTKSLATQEGEILAAKTEIVQLVADQQHNTKRTETVVVEEAGETVITEKKALQLEDGSIHDQSLSVTKVIQKQDGQVEIIENEQLLEDDNKQELYEQVDSVIKEPAETQMNPVDFVEKKEEQGEVSKVQKQVVQDLQGNIHTYEKQVIQKDGSQTVIKTEVVEDPEGQVLSMKTDIVEIKQIQDQQRQIHETSVVVGDKVTTTQTFALENAEGCVILEKTKKVEVQEEQGVLKTTKIDIIQEEGTTTICEVQTVQNQNGAVIEKNESQLVITANQQAEKQPVQKQQGIQIQRQQTAKQEEDKQQQIQQQQAFKQVSQISQNVASEIAKEEGQVSQEEKIGENNEAKTEEAQSMEKVQGEAKMKEVETKQQIDISGNKHTVKRQIIDENGQTITVEQETVQNPSGEIIKIQTEIVSEEQLENGKVQRYEAEIVEEGGKVKVVEYTEIRESEVSGQSMNESSNKDMQSSRKANELHNLLGLSQSEQGQQVKIIIQQSQKVSQNENLLQFSDHKIEQSEQINLLDDDNQKISDKNLAELPLESKKQLTFGFKKIEINQVQDIDDNLIPEQYDIIVISKQRNQIYLRVRYDEIIDEVAQKLSPLINQSKDRIKFYKDGTQLQEYEMISDLDIGPETHLYYLIQEQQEEQEEEEEA